MGKIEIVSASAGTGKTYYLSHKLPELVGGNQVAPDRILATTFTNKAADELTARIRTELLRAGRAVDAHKLSLSYIGTVNSVCDRFLRDFAFDLGLSPDLQVADEKAAQTMLDEAVGQVASVEELRELAALAARMSGEANPHQGSGLADWRSHLAKIVDLARSNGLSPGDLAECGTRSVAALQESCMGEEAMDDLGGRLLQALESSFNGLAKTNKNKVRPLLDALKHGRPGKWADWDKAGKLPDKHIDIADLARQYPRHSRFRADMRRQIELVFALASRALQAYEEQKTAMGMVDFTDQETLVLRLLEDETITQRLHQRFDLVLVDEFQDTSPLQLAIFLKLSTLAPRSIWVGDQKQAIYGFRGADPELMNAAVAAVEESGNGAVEAPKILDKSWRSRRELVEFTSDLFVPAFQTSIGLPEDHVRITAADPILDEPDGLGPVLETWPASGTKQESIEQVAQNILSLLQDEDVKIWHHRDDPEPRAVEPRDIAVLYQTNNDCAAAATALRNLGLPVRLASPGLLRTPEGKLLHAALRLWNDASDQLAAAEIARLVRPDDEALDVVRDVLTDSEQIRKDNTVAAILEASKERRDAGVALAFNRILEILPAAELMQRWGDFDQRVANLEAMRAHLETYLGEAETMGRPQTITGFLVWLDKLLETKEGDTGGARSGNAVTVSTWHKAKGLEWPVVILCDWDQQRSHNAFGVHMETAEKFDIANPLSGRWIRYWPNPLSSRTKEAPILGAVEGESLKVAERERREELRKLYVAATRPRTRLVLVRKDNELPDALRELLQFDGTASTVRVGDNKYEAASRTLEDTGQSGFGTGPEAPAWYPDPTSTPEYPPAYKQPSAILPCAEATVGEPQSLGGRIPLNGKPKMSDLGNAVHNFLAADRPGHDPDHRIKIADRLLAGHDVEGAISSEDLLRISDRLHNWISQTWPDAEIHREYPIRHRIENGTLIEGTADLVLETPDGLVLIDHKTYPGGHQQCLEKTREFTGQLNAYAQALHLATGTPVIETHIHYPTSGYLASIN